MSVSTVQSHDANENIGHLHMYHYTVCQTVDLQTVLHLHIHGLLVQAI